jgi:hypothetical protein
MPEIYLTTTESASMQQSPAEPEVGKTQRKLSFLLQTDSEIVDYERKQGVHFWLEKVRELREKGNASIASHENPLVTPCAGAVSLFQDNHGNTRYVSFSQKDDKAPRDTGFRVPRNGFPTCREDWFTLNHLYREAFEEGIFMTRSGNELVLAENPEYDPIINEVADMLVSKTGLNIQGTKRVPITFRDGRDTLVVYKLGKEDIILERRGAISWTPETGFNFIQLMEVEYPISELYLVDGETSSDGTPLCRDVCVLDLHESQGKLFGEEVYEDVHRYDRGIHRVVTRRDRFLIDKVSRSVLNQVYVGEQPVYPIDWMVESHAFLRNPRVIRDNSRFKWSELEKNIKLG